MRKGIGKKLWGLTLTLAMVLTMTVTALPVYAAGGSISVTFDPEVPDLTGQKFTFDVYKVGTYSRNEETGKSILVVDPAVRSIAGVTLTDEVFSDVETVDGMVNAAGIIAQYTDKFDSVKVGGPVEITVGDTATVATVSENGIYLIVGNKIKVGDLYWNPVPVLVQVLNGDAKFAFDKDHVKPKINSCPVIYSHNVKKVWNDNNNEKGLRPEYVDVEILYGDKVIDTVTLNDANNWNFTWTTTEAGEKEYSSSQRTKKFNEKDYPGEGPYTYKLTAAEAEGSHTWSAREVFTTDNKLLYNYYVQESVGVVINEETVGTTTSEDGIQEFITIGNTFKTKKLIINKTLKNFATIGTGMNASVVFEVTGYGQKDGKEVVMYHTKTGLVFDRPGSDSVEVSNIPVNLTRLKVEEVYSTNYKVVDGDNPVNATEADGVYTASFTNNHTPGDDPPPFTGSIVNKYSKGEDGKYTYKGQRGLQ